MSWNIGKDRNVFLKLKSKLGLYHVVLSTPKLTPAKLTLTIVEMQQLPNVEKTGTDVSCLKWTLFNGRRKICISFQTDTDNVNIVAYRYRNNVHLKDAEIKLSLCEYENLLSKKVYLLSYLDVFSKRCIVLDESTVHN